MKKLWEYKQLELITWFVFAVLVCTSILILYSSYSDYNAIMSSSTHIEKAFEYKIIMMVSSIVLIFSLSIMYIKRDYFFANSNIDDTEALEGLLEEIKLSSDSSKIHQFKSMLKDRDHTEIYSLIANMINDLQESKKSADEANRVKSLFLSNMSHEIRTPLNGVVGFTKLLRSTKLDEEQKDFVDTIRKSSENLIGIIDDILDISKIESGKVEIEKSYFNIIAEFENVIESYAFEASKRNIAFAIWLDPELSSLLVENDYGKIRQILVNLISNAIKFTPDGGKIYVSIKKLDSNGDNIKVAFTVKDTGIGISQEQKERVFDAFTQVDDSSIRKYGGTGLGLTISTGLVKLLGGSLELESEIDAGSSVSFVLDMPYRAITKEYNYSPMKIALYAPDSVQVKDSNKYLERYLRSFKDISIERFDTFVECQDAPPNSFDALYIHYDEIEKSELKRIVARHTSDTQLILVTKLKNRDEILDIAPIFSQVIYESISFSKIENSIEQLSLNKKESVETKIAMFMGLKALVIEDNFVNLKMIMRTLENLGVHSDSAEDGKIGVEMYKKNKYDVVFMDIQMPVMNGVDATKAIIKYEKDNGLEHTPIIAVTTNTLKGDRERYLAVGMDEYIAKPIDLNKFITALTQFYSTVHVSRKSVKKDILLYKQTPTESKILGSILNKLNYSVNIAKSIDEFKDMMDSSSYRSLLLDRISSNDLHQEVTKKIREKHIPTLLLIDDGVDLTPHDIETYAHVLDRDSDFSLIKDRVDSMCYALQ